MLRPGGGGWHAYPPQAAVEAVDRLAALEPGKVLVLDPAFGYEAGWRRAVLDLLARQDRRDLALSVTARPEQLQRLDVDKLYRARAGLVLELGTLSPSLLGRTGQAPNPRKAVDHALDLLEYLGAKGVATHARFEFNQPGETEETAEETLDALERSRERRAQHLGDRRRADVGVPADRASPGPTWTRPPRGSARASSTRSGGRSAPTRAPLATAVVASAELAGRPAGDESYWRPRFEELQAALDAKLTAEARRGLRSHETVGSAAYGVPHGWWTEPKLALTAHVCPLAGHRLYSVGRSGPR